MAYNYQFVPPHEMDKSFQVFDINSTGKLSFIEFQLLCCSLFKNDKSCKNVSESQLQELFSVFDQNKDGFIDKVEFTFMWNHWVKVILEPRKSVLLVVDVQNDFISGSLGPKSCPIEENGIEVVEPINKLLESFKFDNVVYSFDWHPENHISFVDAVTKRELDPSCPIKVEDVKAFDTVVFKGPPSMTQTLYPSHCVQGSWGAELYKDLKIVDGAIKVYKGKNPDIDSYSCFWDNERRSETELHQELQSRNITDVFVCGLANDICVGFTTLDALKYGYRTYLVDDCCRGVSLANIVKMHDRIVKEGGVIINSDQVEAIMKNLDFDDYYKLAMKLKDKVHKE